MVFDAESHPGQPGPFGTPQGFEDFHGALGQRYALVGQIWKRANGPAEHGVANPGREGIPGGPADVQDFLSQRQGVVMIVNFEGEGDCPEAI